MVFLSMPVAYSLLALARAECKRAAALAKRRMVAFAVGGWVGGPCWRAVKKM